MKVENRVENFWLAPCGSKEKPLIAGGLAGWRRGYAADCKSVHETSPIPFCHRENSASRCFCKHAGQSRNKPEILKTGWWVAPFALAGAAMWACVIVAWWL